MMNPINSAASTPTLMNTARQSQEAKQPEKPMPEITMDFSETRILKHFFAPRTPKEEAAHAEVKSAILELQEYERYLKDFEKIVDPETKRAFKDDPAGAVSEIVSDSPGTGGSYQQYGDLQLRVELTI
ncbi:hypothetical protein [Pseudovibrio sp. JE062]|uniref:hypothetical protein n=1 Tax=Pseudovibrio sp. JE062 TaxID=439495 RepID=UPI000186B5EA|nr:hypothetical protein [Pseudovibrio sp. JE062]EEA94334.1 hypothetical protein PJE062_319 [Pseudovibrio sp. JE062]